jgi:ATP-dependent helicase HrpB
VSDALPIDPLLPQITAALRERSRLILRAAPGAGKTTRVPAALLDAGAAGGRQVVVLEPRRIAARAAAEYVAARRDGSVGGEVGYRVRFESRGGAATRLWFVTEGVLGRQLARDPYLEDVGVLVLDEFHERHVQTDVALGVVRELQTTVRPDLLLVVMSATLETQRLAEYLGECPVLSSEGRTFPVTVEYRSRDGALSQRVAEAVSDVVTCDPVGDVLVFLPGAAEIRRAAAALTRLAVDHDLDVVPLHGDLPLEAQRRVLFPGRRRKVVLATNVAETSLTIEGVTAVIDSGLARIARRDTRHGINRLDVARISRASAEQRAGRAGRTAPGRCIRLWSRAEDVHLREREVPEIQRLELSTTVLELRSWGLRDLAGFAWLDPPPPAALESAERLLRFLGAVDPSGTVTLLGREMLHRPLSPRLSRLLIEAETRGCARGGASLAALISERDILLSHRAFRHGVLPVGRHEPGPARSDLLHRGDLLDEAARSRFDPGVCGRLGVDAHTARTVDRLRQHLVRLCRRTNDRLAPNGDEDLLRCVLAAFPDRVARRREAGTNRAVMVGGSGVVLDERSLVHQAELFVAVELEAGRRGERGDPRVLVASAIEAPWLSELFPAAVTICTSLVFDPDRERVVQRRQRLYHDLVLEEHSDADVDARAAGEVLAEILASNPWQLVSSGSLEERFLARLRFLRATLPDLVELDEPAHLLQRAAVSLAAGRRSLAEVRRGSLDQALRTQIDRRALALLDREAPERLTLPGGRSTPIFYPPDRPPWIEARIQELFGLRASPQIARGRCRLVVHLLAPNGRPVQVTDDLASFWSRTYAEVRKTLRGRYPKHAWPEDPLTAAPSSRPARGPARS